MSGSFKKRKPQVEAPESLTRAELEKKYGRVWNTRELAQEFVITSIIDHEVVVRRKADDVVGKMSFQNTPRYYHSFVPAVSDGGPV